ncbi:Uncharacterized protein Adt_31476 [Abeliophyllum distichum]|uniref:Uncharacterized protein n=1 Tax=Abeliophyllum distichum TaxID=126358 RepID=A0ABD1RE82_9LAMI
MMGCKIAETMSKKCGKQRSLVLEVDHFVPEVMVVPLPQDFEQPKMDKYDGFSNPVNHLRAFVDLMRLRATSDVILCRAFLPIHRWETRDCVVTLLICTLITSLRCLLHTLIAASKLRKQLSD